jgi:hypothetical protein
MSIVAGVIGACISLIGVVVGAWINHHRQDRRWLRDKKLEAAAEFIAAAGQIYDHRHRPSHREVSAEMVSEWDARMQNGRSVLHLLCEPSTVEHADALARRVFAENIADPDHHAATIESLRAFTGQMRRDLGERSRWWDEGARLPSTRPPQRQSADARR